MANKSKQRSDQARRQKRKRKEVQRKKQKARGGTRSSTVKIGARHQEQVKKLVPRAWPNENILDVAIFDDSVFEALEPSDQLLVSAIKEAFDLLSRDRLNDAENAIAHIPRKSPMSDWRMLVRGLKYWLANELEAAKKAWSRLDSSRRPSRIACALQLAHRDDLATLNASTSHKLIPPDSKTTATPTDQADPNSRELVVDSANINPPVDIDNSLLLAAKVVRRTRIARSAINFARAGVAQSAEIEDFVDGLTISPEKIKWLKEFSNGFRQTEPKLVRALELAALERASHQKFIDVFEMATKYLRGPIHDPNNNLRSFNFMLDGENTEHRAAAYLKKYLEVDLPANKQLSPQLSKALISTAWLNEARTEMQYGDTREMPFSNFLNLRGDPAVSVRIGMSFTKAIDAYPANREAHIVRANWLEKEIENPNAHKKKIESLKNELLAAMKCWATSLDTDVRPRQFLAEVLLENEQLEEAEPHVKWLELSRPNDPRVKALPWKLKLFEAMKLCRRTTNLPQVPAVLDQVNSQWPSWQSTRWAPYFNAAWVLRSGDHAGYESQRKSICSTYNMTRDSLPDACMMLGAAQKMKVSSADLKPLRQPVDWAVKNIASVRHEELIQAGCFFWNMYKSRIFYPAFRMHGGKIAHELLARINGVTGLVSNEIENPDFVESVFWLSERRFLGDPYDSAFPESLEHFVGNNVHVTAAYLNALLKMRFLRSRSDETLLETVAFLKKSVRTEPDAFNRYWFGELLEKFEAKKQEAEQSYGLGGAFGNLADRLFGLEEDEFECDCPACVAERERQIELF